MLYVAVDIGGTFTDLVAFDASTGELFHAKQLSTPRELVRGVLDCLEKSGISLNRVGQLIHGSTVAINALIERKGARTALLVTAGTRDCYAIGRGNRPEAYNLLFERPRALVPRHAIYEIDERLQARGDVYVPIDPVSVEKAGAAIAAGNYDAVAVCFLHSYANPAHERTAVDLLSKMLPAAYISASHEIMREYREYERISTTAVNAYIGPRVSGYVKELETGLRHRGFDGELSIMQSNGGVMSPRVAARRPVTMMESGPVGGIIASAEVGRVLGFENVISFDMGGTTAKASLVLGGTPTMADGYWVGGHASGDPVMVPVVDVIEVGTGGGSIAWVDDLGGLKVGPHSAGSEPGPICYGRGGTEPTITDANVVLGRIDAGAFLGGEMQLDADSALDGLARKVASPLGLTPFDAARAVIDVSTAKMSLAVRQVSVEKGHDPRDFALVASGGGGPVHASAIARELKIPIVIIPRFPAHFSALGMLLADERHDFVRTHLEPLDRMSFAELDRICGELEADALQASRRRDADLKFALDLRYAGQEFSLSVPVMREQIQAGDHAGIRASFNALHEDRYAHSAPDEPVEMINVRLTLMARRAKPAMPRPAGHSRPPERRLVHFGKGGPSNCAVLPRESLAAGAGIDGPALIQEYGSTTVLFPGDSCTVADSGELIVNVGQEGQA
ncbi:MAG: hydantoinase/oxoprolinase family protein [Hyphomicrobiaceae bacterium]